MKSKYEKIDILMKIIYLVWKKKRILISTSQAKQAKILDDDWYMTAVDFKDFGVLFCKDRDNISIISEQNHE